MKRLLAVVACSGLAFAAQAQPAFQVIARTGTSYPGLPPGTTIENLSSDPSIAPDGTVVLSCFLSGPSIPLYHALCSIDTTGPRILARGGDPAVGAVPGQLICGATVSQCVAFSNGAAFFTGISNTSGICDTNPPSALYRISQGGNLEPVVLPGHAAPGIPGSVFAGTLYHFDHSSTSVFCANTSTTPGIIDGPGIWVGLPGQTSLLVRRGDPTPGTFGDSFVRFSGDMCANSAGHVTFTAMGQTGLPGGLYISGPAGLTEVLRAPLLTSHYPGYQLLPPAGIGLSINNADQLAFMGYLEPAPGNPAVATHSGIWIWTAGQFQPVAVEDDIAPGTAARFFNIGAQSPPQFLDFSDAGEVAFTSNLYGDGLGNMGLWFGAPGALRLAARRLDQVPDMPAGYKFSTFESYALNSRGQLVFVATFTVPGSNNSQAIFLADRTHPPKAIARIGSLFPNGQGTLEAISFLSLSNHSAGGQDGRPTPFNDSGRLVIRIHFASSPHVAIAITDLAAPCYANCDYSNGTPLLTANDFICFLNSFAGGDTYANCDGSTTAPVLTPDDFLCFLNAYAAGCSR